MAWAVWASGHDASAVLAEQWTSEFDKPEEQEVDFAASTWREWLTQKTRCASTTASLGGCSITGFSRGDLKRLSLRAGDPAARLDLFIATMIWGRGKSNGRMRDPMTRAIRTIATDSEILRRSARLIREGDVVSAYRDLDERRLGIREAFFTKWLYAAGLRWDGDVAPLVLDSNVWAALGALGWSSGEREPSRRYLRYLEQCRKWADQLSSGSAVGRFTPEGIEMQLFTLGKRIPRTCRGRSHACEVCRRLLAAES